MRRYDLLASTAIVTGPALPRPPQTTTLETHTAFAVGDLLAFTSAAGGATKTGRVLSVTTGDVPGVTRHLVELTDIAAAIEDAAALAHAARGTPHRLQLYFDAAMERLVYDSGPMPISGD